MLPPHRDLTQARVGRCLDELGCRFYTAVVEMAACVSASRGTALRSKRMVGGTLAPLVPWQAMVYLSDKVLTGGYAGGALISDRWVLTAGRNLFVRKSREDTQGKTPLIPKVYLGITGVAEAKPPREVAVEKVSKKNKDRTGN